MRLALIVAASCVLLGALIVVIFAKPADDQAGDNSFAGSLRPKKIVPNDFTLKNEHGNAVSLSDYKGRPLILTFMYSTCKDTCPLQANQIRGALDQLGDDAIPALAVSVDPANDTPARARRFLVQRRLSDRMSFLLGSRAQLEPIWAEYGIQPQGKGFEHSAYVLLLDARGRQRIGFPSQYVTPEGLVHDIRLLEAEQTQAEAVLPGHSREPSALEWNPGRKAVAAASARSAAAL